MNLEKQECACDLIGYPEAEQRRHAALTDAADAGLASHAQMLEDAAEAYMQADAALLAAYVADGWSRVPR